jgi:dipeptidase D
MKKIFGHLLILGLMFALVACSVEDAPVPEYTVAEDVPVPEYTVAEDVPVPEYTVDEIKEPSEEVAQSLEEDRLYTADEEFITIGPQCIIEERAFAYFLELLKIPRTSGNERQISDYLAAFAQEHGLEFVQDSSLNVFIRKPGTPGREDEPPVILQVHMDMVGVAEGNHPHDFLTDPIIPVIEGDWITAYRTSLGADNGGGMAIVMTILASEDLSHPPIEALFTTEEETTMAGAANFDISQFRGRRFINIDTFEGDSIVTGAAGSATVRASIESMFITPPEGLTPHILSIRGLLGGHSGTDIDRGHANAINLMARVLDALDDGNVFVTGIIGGTVSNAIPMECTAVISFAPEESERIQSVLTQLEEQFRAEYPYDVNMTITFEKMTEDYIRQVGLSRFLVETDTAAKYAMSRGTLRNTLEMILTTPIGVIAMSDYFDGLVQTSNNLATIVTNPRPVSADEAFEVVISNFLRSSSSEELGLLRNELIAAAEEVGAFAHGRTGLSPWVFREDSSLCDTMAYVYESLFGEPPTITGIHAGLEVNLFSQFMRDADFVAIGIDIEYAHSPGERMSISSFNRTLSFLIAVLEELNY